MISVLYFSKQESLNLSMSCLSSELLAKVQNVHGEKMLRRVDANLFFFFFTGYDKVDEIFVHETLLNQ